MDTVRDTANSNSSAFGTRVCIALCAAILLVSAPVAAGDTATAEAMFRQGRQLMDQGKYAEAIESFNDSDKAEPSVGAKLNLGDCYERLGKTATAWAKYGEAKVLAQRLGQPDREKLATTAETRLLAKLSYLTINVATPRPDGLKVVSNDAVVGSGRFGVAVPVDPGQYRIEATAPNHQAYHTVVVVGAERDRQVVNVPALILLPPEQRQPTGGDQPTDGRRSAHLTAAWITGGVGLAGLIVGAALGGAAASKWSDAQDKCAPIETGDWENCTTDDGPSLRDDAKLMADISTAGFIIGGAGIVTAITLWLTAPSGPEEQPDRAGWSVKFAPVVSDQAAGMWVVGEF